MADSFVIEEATGSDRIRVVLENHDLPQGRPRRGAAFNLGGKVERTVIRLDGRTTPIIHARYPDFHPTKVQGHLRDHLAAQVGHAKSQMRALERLRQRMRAVTCTWSDLRWTAFLEETNFGVEGDGDITYELNFDVIQAPGTDAGAVGARVESAPADLAAQARALIAEDMAKMAALAITSAVENTYAQALASVDASLANLADACADFESADTRLTAPALAVLGKAAEAQAQIGAALQTGAMLLASGGGDVLTLLTTDVAAQVAAWWAWAYGLELDLSSVADGVRTIAFTARQRINATTRLYVVKQGDTLESIARGMLGSAARATEIGYRPSDIQPGRTIRIPLGG